jgi:hypothetical protein
MYDTQLVFRLCPSSGILKTRNKHFRNWICFHLQVRGTDTYPVGPLERANLDHWTTHVKFTIVIYIPETQLYHREITGKYTIKTLIKHAIYGT